MSMCLLRSQGKQCRRHKWVHIVHMDTWCLPPRRMPGTPVPWSCTQAWPNWSTRSLPDLYKAKAMPQLLTTKSLKLRLWLQVRSCVRAATALQYIQCMFCTSLPNISRSSYVARPSEVYVDASLRRHQHLPERHNEIVKGKAFSIPL